MQEGVALGPPYSCVDWSCSFLTHSHSQCRVAPEYSVKHSSAHPRGDFAIRTVLVVLLSFQEEFKHCLDNAISQEDKILCGINRTRKRRSAKIVSARLRGRKSGKEGEVQPEKKQRSGDDLQSDHLEHSRSERVASR